ncbi:MAG TPA: DUF2703 domain-containing protein [Candidatus Acidoferrales bacterium]|nr:DUF2703 domain-containing protein [Candidatus Acidoferrales bacterium]
MKIEVLYVAECPSHHAAVQLLKDELAAQGVAAEIRQILVADAAMARQLRFCGSPTIRINGRDVAGEPPGTESYALSCRLYAGAKPAGLPPAEMVRRAVAEARQGDLR